MFEVHETKAVQFSKIQSMLYLYLEYLNISINNKVDVYNGINLSPDDTAKVTASPHFPSTPLFAIDKTK